MSYAPATISELAAYWTRHKGVNLGIVGSASHTGGYHLGKDRLAGHPRDYSIQTARDKRGLTNAASALDLGKLAGSLHNLQEFSKWFVGRCRANAAGTRDVREVIYSPDGTAVLRWDRERGYGSAPRSGESDVGHRTHTHIGFYRDSEHRAKVELFAPYFAPPQEADMPLLVSYIPGHIALLMAADGVKVRIAPTLAADVIRTIASDTSESWTVTGWVKGEASGTSDQWLARWFGGRWEYTHKTNVAKIGPPPDTTPFDQAALDAAKEAGTRAGETSNEAKWRVWLDSAPRGVVP